MGYGHLRNPNPSRPHSRIVLFPPDTFCWFQVTYSQAKNRLDNLLQDNIADDIQPGHVIPFQNFRGSVQSVLRQVVIHVYPMEEQRYRPVGDDREQKS